MLRRHSRTADIHARVAGRARAERLLPILDIGCGDGELARHLGEGEWVGVDASREMVRRAPRGALHGEATALPFADASFGSAALLYVLYHLPRPAEALAEARRVLRPGGLLAVALPSRHDSPELAHALPRRQITADAESAGALLAACFPSVEAEAWDAPVLRLPTKEDVRDYLVGKGTELRAAARAAAVADVPLTVSKRGALFFARKAPDGT